MAVGIVALIRRDRPARRNRPPTDEATDQATDEAGGAGRGGAGQARSRLSRWSRSWKAALALLLLFGMWVGASAAWGEDPELALGEGAAYLLLTLGAGALGWSGLAWERALDAWLLGTGLVLVAAAGLVALGPEPWASRMLHEGGWLTNQPWARLRGPFAHPGVFGDYLVVSGIFLWARWPAWTAPGREGTPASGARSAALGSATGLRSARTRLILAWTAAGVLAAALLLTASTAWLPAGVLLLVWGRRLTPRRRKDVPDDRVPGAGAWIRSLGLRAAGATLAAVTLAALVFPLRIAWRGVEVVSPGIGPALWSRAVAAFLRAPFVGAGAIPGAAGVPADAGAVPTDAGSVYLSLLGQFGVVGFLLAAVAAVVLVRALRRPLRPDGSPDLGVVREGGDGRPPGRLLWNRVRVALLAALLAMGTHGLAVAGEDFRHWWAVVGLTGMVAAVRSESERA